MAIGYFSSPGTVSRGPDSEREFAVRGRGDSK